MLTRTHIQTIVHMMDRIDWTKWSPAEKRRQKRQIFEAAMHEFADRGWEHAERYLEQVKEGEIKMEKSRSKI